MSPSGHAEHTDDLASQYPDREYPDLPADAEALGAPSVQDMPDSEYNLYRRPIAWSHHRFSRAED